MKTFVALIAVAVLPLGIMPVHASPELATKSNCMACHDMEKKELGPTFTDISAKYKMASVAARGTLKPCLQSQS